MEKWKGILLLFQLFQLCSTCWGESCSYYTQSISNSSIPNQNFNLSSQTGILHNCPSCLTIWYKLPDGTSKVLEQGCFLNQELCHGSQLCIQDENLKQHLSLKKSLSACCCTGSMCNREFLSNRNEASDLVVVFITSVVLALLVLTFLSMVTLFYKLRLRKRLQKAVDLECKLEDDWLISNDSANAVEEDRNKLVSDSSDETIKTFHLDFDGYEVLDTIHRGQFSSIFKVVKDKKIGLAWKQYNSSDDKQRFYNERDVYELLSISNSTLFLQFFGSHDAVDDDHKWIICLELASKGSVASYLKTNTLGWTELCAMLVDVSQGLSHLHNTYGVVHRKLNSSNIFIRDLNSCCIGDFSHAGVNYNSNISNGIILDHSENIRYQAPEVLDGFLNVSWTQVDIYALGLLFWEMSLRCHELYQGVGVPPFQMAFEKEIGKFPSKEQMKIMVSRNKARPLFPQVWKNSNPAIQQLKMTIMESWDDDGEARLTACCIVERVRELDPLWNRYKLVSAGPPILDLIQPNNTQPRHEAKKTMFYPNILNTESVIKNKNDNIESGQHPLVKIQPHQGLNPCLERNFITNVGNVSNEPFIIGSMKDKAKPKPKTNDESTVSVINSTRSRASFVNPIERLENDIRRKSTRNKKNLNNLASIKARNNAGIH